MKDKLINGFCLAIALFFPFALLLVVFPLDIFSNNLQELNGNILTISPLLNIAAVLGAICLAIGLGLSFLRFKGLFGIAVLGLYLGFYVLVSDLIAPLAIDKHIGFDGSENILQPPTIQIIFDVVAFLVLVALFFRFRGPSVVKIGVTMASVFMAMTLASSLPKIQSMEAESYNHDLSSYEWKVKVQPPEFPADYPNVYHLVLDGFQGILLPYTMELAGITDEDFDGFTYFPKNRSNYDGTQMSIPSFMSGTIYREGSMKEWYGAWHKTGMWNKIKEIYAVNLQVYHTSDPGHGGYLQGPYNATRKMPDSIAGTRWAGDFTNIIFHLSLARVAPSYLHKYIFRNGEGKFSPKKSITLDEIDPRIQPFKLLIDDEDSRAPRGQYAFMHVFVPHSPYLLDEKCQMHHGGSPSVNFSSQSACSLQYVRKFIDNLKRLDRYRDSVIIIHSDHGFALEGEPIEPLTGSAAELRIPEVDVTERTPRSAKHLDTMTAALLMVKPSGSSGVPMATSKRSTQLLDIPNTMYDMLSLDIKAPEGMSVLSKDYPEVVERHIYPGFRRWDHVADKQTWVAKDVFEGELNHFSWTSGKGWKVYPNMPFSWE